MKSTTGKNVAKDLLKALCTAARYALMIMVCMFVTVVAISLGANIADVVVRSLASHGIVAQQEMALTFIVLLSGMCGASFVVVPKLCWKGLDKLTHKVVTIISDWRAAHGRA